MINFYKHNEDLKQSYNDKTPAKSHNLSNSVCLDSIDDILRECLDLEEMRKAGSFFTGQKLASLLVSKFSSPIDTSSVVVDPTCGAGNLLIESSRHLPVFPSLKNTLEAWGKVLHGYDIYDAFIEAAKLRLIFEAIGRGALQDCTIEESLSLLQNIKVKDVMSLSEGEFEKATHALMNPPFTQWSSPNSGFWKKGKVNAAGIVFEHILNILPASCSVSTLLPEVLRSGSRYECWRQYVESKFRGTAEVFGRFNAKTDVDVFILSGIKSSSCSTDLIAWNRASFGKARIDDLFLVHIGPLVAYRDPENGGLHPYLHPKNASPWLTLNNINETRRFSGKVFRAPFVVIRRTSSPSDQYRAVASVVNVKEPVAVENHLIVLQPKDGELRTCEKLINILKTQETNKYLNNTIRLRHLTVGAVKSIPL